MTGFFGTATAGAVVLLAAAAPAVTATPSVSVGSDVVPLAQGSPISAGSGYAVFSTYDPASRRFQLALSDGTTTATIPKAAKTTTPFDASMGTDKRGRPVVTRAQCTHESELNVLRRGCSVRSYDVRSRTWATLPIEPTRNGSAWLPVLDHGTLVYARLRDLGSRGRGDARWHRYRFEIIRRDRHGRTHQVPAGTNATVAVDISAGQSVWNKGTGAASLTAVNGRIAYTWATTDETCPIDQTHSENPPFSGTLYLVAGTKRRTVERGCELGKNQPPSSPSIIGTRLQWLSGKGANGVSSHVIATRSATGSITRSDVQLATGDRIAAMSSDALASWYVIYGTKGDRLTRLPR